MTNDERALGIDAVEQVGTHEVIPMERQASPPALPNEPYFSESMKQKRCERIVNGVRAELLAGEFIAAVASCNNFRPWILDAVVVTNCRILAVDVTPVIKWSIELPDVRWIETDPNASQTAADPALWVHGVEEEPLKFKMVPRDIHSCVIGAVNYRRHSQLPVQYIADREGRAMQKRADEGAREAALAKQWPQAIVKGLTLSKRNSMAIHEHCQPGESPWLILVGEGALAAFEDRLIIVKSGWLSATNAGAFGGGRTTTFYYRDINAIEYNSGMMTGVLEVLTASYQGTANEDYWRGATKSRNANANDPHTLSNTLPFWKGEYQKASGEINELRRRISVAKSAPTMYIPPYPMGSGNAPGVNSQGLVPAPVGQAPMVGMPPASLPAPVTADQQSAEPEAKPSPGSGRAWVEELSKLGELWKAGVLTDEEFAAAKAKLLSTEN